MSLQSLKPILISAHAVPPGHTQDLIKPGSMELKFIVFGIYFLTALTISPSYGRPEKSDAEGVIDLLEFQVHEDPNEIPKEIEQIISEDWADTWEASQEMKEWFPYHITGKTEDGATVFVKEFGKWKFVDLVEKRGKESLDEFNKYYEQYLHRLFKEGKQDGVIMIFDFEGFSLQNFNNRLSFQLALRQISTLEKSSKVLKELFVVNTNFPAQTFLNMGRPFLGTVLQTAEIYGTQKQKWLPKLLKKVPKEVLPKEYF